MTWQAIYTDKYNSTSITRTFIYKSRLYSVTSVSCCNENTDRRLLFGCVKIEDKMAALNSQISAF